MISRENAGEAVVQRIATRACRLLFFVKFDLLVFPEASEACHLKSKLMKCRSCQVRTTTGCSQRLFLCDYTMTPFLSEIS